MGERRVNHNSIFFIEFGPLYFTVKGVMIRNPFPSMNGGVKQQFIVFAG